MKPLTPAQRWMLDLVRSFSGAARQKGDPDGWFNYHDLFYYLDLPKYLEAATAGRTWAVLLRLGLVEAHPDRTCDLVRAKAAA